MTETLRDRVAYLKDLLWLGGILAAILSTITTIVFAGVLALWGPQLRDLVRDWLGVDDNAHMIERVMGENRVTKQQAGQSYVREPVKLGDTVTLVMMIGRTEIGAGCRLLEIIPIFTDDNGVAQAGSGRRPSQQLGPQVVRRELDIQQPEGLVPGRVSLELQLEYDCGGAIVFETTDPVSYYALSNLGE